MKPICPTANPDNRPRDLPAEDFYVDWAKTEFGSEVAEPVAKPLPSLTVKGTWALIKAGRLLSRPATVGQRSRRHFSQIAGPGTRSRQEYAFVDDLAALHSKVRGPALSNVLTISDTPCSYLRRGGSDRLQPGAAEIPPP